MNITFKSYLNELCCFLFELLSHEEYFRSFITGSTKPRPEILKGVAFHMK